MKYRVTKKVFFKMEAGQRLVVTTTSHQKIYVFRILLVIGYFRSQLTTLWGLGGHKGHKESLKNLFIKRNIFSARENMLK